MENRNVNKNQKLDFQKSLIWLSNHIQGFLRSSFQSLEFVFVFLPLIVVLGDGDRFRCGDILICFLCGYGEPFLCGG
jgi:hypothetical protein